MNKTFLVANLLFGCAIVHALGACDAGWKSFGKKCYKFVAKAGLNQHDALVACKDMGGSLASVHSDAEHKFMLETMAPATRSWIGLQLIHKSPTNTSLVSCHWVDGSAFDYGICEFGISKQPWREEEPNNYLDQKELCVVYANSNGDGWVDINCNATGWTGKFGYVCNK